MIAALALTAAPVQAQQINIGPSGGTVGFWAYTSIPLIGQTFQAPASMLTDFTFQLSYHSLGDGLLPYTANVGTWTGSTVGSVLWTSATQVGPTTLGTPLLPYTFNTGGLGLTAGTTYVAFLQALGGSMQGLFATGEFGVYGGGETVYSLASGPSGDWYGLPSTDLAFVANFSDDVVPEPATMTLLATGLAGMAAARRRKRNA
jgi:hypothetical protein